ncbi:MAG: dihydroorotate dehydrogenase electron transfer subunit [Candidatus Micrarchaeota archaeon]|nr:dihydroorotate dehydrogenase electron transfer subunit [Candidatus Micrarchaeota archaeon]
MLPQPVKVVKIEKENQSVVTLTLSCRMPEAVPGQFLMVWLPAQQEEKPYSLADNDPVKITVGARGPFSTALCSLKKGDFVWIRGPYGRGFELKGKKILLVGGGYGFAPLRFLAKEARKKKISAIAVCGARTKSLLLKAASCKTIYTTDDGSYGIPGNVLAGMAFLFKKHKFDLVYSCGPEKMMQAVAKEAEKRKIASQLLLERYMKCGIGVCGHCCCGELLVCVDGPMFWYSQLKSNPEFGKIWRDKSGKKVSI